MIWFVGLVGLVGLLVWLVGWLVSWLVWFVDLIGDGTLNLNQFYQNPMRTENGKFKFNVEYVDLVCRGKSAGRLLLSI